MCLFFFFLMIRRPPRSTLFPYTDALPICILVTNTPDVLTDTTADFAFALLMAAARRIVDGHQFLHAGKWSKWRSEEHTSELQSLRHLVCRLLLEKKK